ncbi:MAG: hypothetical protein ACI4RA_07240 [Kiritimatiellia bacterium]
MNDNRTEMAPRYRACDSYVHANMKGTGSACRFELHPAHEDTPGSVFAQLAPQKTIGSSRGGGQGFATFDWEKKIVIKLDRADLAQILQVLRGMRETVNDGKGLFHRSARGNTVIRFSHQIEPRPGYLLAVSRKTVEGDLRSCSFLFDENEALALMLSLEQSMMYVCFGVPIVMERRAQTTAVSRETRAVPIPVQMPQTAEQSAYRPVAGGAF